MEWDQVYRKPLSDEDKETVKSEVERLLENNKHRKHAFIRKSSEKLDSIFREHMYDFVNMSKLYPKKDGDVLIQIDKKWSSNFAGASVVKLSDLLSNNVYLLDEITPTEASVAIINKDAAAWEKINQELREEVGDGD